MSLLTKQPWSRFRGARSGNVTMMFALGVPFLMLGVAVAIDFTNATVARSKLNADADAAALAALTPAMMQQPDSVAQAAAVAMFNARADAMSTLVPGQTQVTVTITHPNGPTTRQVVVAYSAQNNAIFSGILGQKFISVSGSSTSQSQVPPNIDFYLLLDNSPSMSLPATQAGINLMQSLTPLQDGGNGCAFACHQASTNNGDTAGNLCAVSTTPVTYSKPTVNNNQYCASTDGKGHTLTQIDNYAMARLNNITLRLDELTSGISTLMNTAYGYQNSGVYATPPAYRFAAYSMDSLWQIGTSNTQLMALTSSYQSGWATASKNFGVMEMFANNYTCGNSSCSTKGSQGDVGTNYDNALSSINTTMPNPGSGSNIAGDTPQEVLFFVTDGVEDEQYGGTRLEQIINGPGGPGTNWCTQIKNRGIKIAILYTQYLAVPANAWYESKIAPFQPDIGPALQACASPNLYYQAAIGADLGQALSTLFNIVAQQAALSN
jgi:Flp pilus assembly protein TadG